MAAYATLSGTKGLQATGALMDLLAGGPMSMQLARHPASCSCRSACTAFKYIYIYIYIIYNTRP